MEKNEIFSELLLKNFEKRKIKASKKMIKLNNTKKLRYRFKTLDK